MRLLMIVLPSLALGCHQDGGLTKFNAQPEALIATPADGSTLVEGAAVTLRGSGSDADDSSADLLATWYVNDVEVCAETLLDASAETACGTVVPASATMEIRLEITDPGSSTGAAYSTVTVTPNEAPVVVITSPEADGAYRADETLTFEGTVTDSETAAADLDAWWEEDGVQLDIDAEPTSEGQVVGYGVLAEGTHALELHATDLDGNEGVASVVIDVGPANSAPDCAITSPASGTVGESGRLVTFSGQVSDADVTADQLAVTWSSDKDGDLGTSVATTDGVVTLPLNSLSVNTHVVTLHVEDDSGATCTTDVVYTVGNAPTITLEAPLDGEVVADGGLVTFTALVADTEDVASDLTVKWESSIDGVFHEGPPDSSGVAQFQDDAFSAGEHALTVTVTDSSGLYATAISTFIVDGVPTAPGVSISPANPYTDDDLVVSIDSPSVDPEGLAVGRRGVFGQHVGHLGGRVDRPRGHVDGGGHRERRLHRERGRHRVGDGVEHRARDHRRHHLAPVAYADEHAHLRLVRLQRSRRGHRRQHHRVDGGRRGRGERHDAQRAVHVRLGGHVHRHTVRRHGRRHPGQRHGHGVEHGPGGQLRHAGAGPRVHR